MLIKGSDGIYGQDPPVPVNSSIATLVWDSFDYFYNMTTNQTVEIEDTDITKIYIGFDVFGRNGTIPTRGGNGGIGGLGGYAGQVFVVGLQEDPGFAIFNNSGKKINIAPFNMLAKSYFGFFLFETGKRGPPGKGGNAGNYSRNGLTLGVVYTDEYNHTTWTLLESGEPIVAFNESGMERIIGLNGTDGISEMGLEHPQAVNLISPGEVINNFKRLAREHLAYSTNQGSLGQFLKDLNENEKNVPLYDTLSFVHELSDLQNQSILLRDTISFTPFLESLLKRIEKYAENFPEPPENKVILRWLYTEVLEALNQLSNIKKNNRNMAILNLPEVENHILTFSALENEAKNNMLQKEYQTSLNNQISLAKKSIQTEIIPKIENIFIEIDSQIRHLMKELVIRQDKYKPPDVDVPQELIDSIPPLENITDAFSFDFPLNSIGSTMNDFYYFRDSMRIKILSAKYDDDDEGPEPDPWCIFVGERETFANEYQLLFELESDIVREMSNIPNDGHFYDLSEIKDKILQSKSILIEKIKSNETENLVEVSQMREDLKQFLKIKQSTVEPTHYLSSLMEYALALLDFRNVDVHTFQQEQFSIEDIEEIMSYNVINPSVYLSINETEKKQRVDLEYYNNYVYNQIVWRFLEMETIIEEIKQNLTRHPHFELEISKWRAQTIIRDVQAFFRNVANETSMKEILYRSFEKLEDSMMILIDAHNQIDLMNVDKTTKKFSTTTSSDAPLSDAVLALKHIKQRNLILEQYEVVVNAFKQYQFPFAHLLLSRFVVPIDLEANNIQSVPQLAVDHINYLKEKISANAMYNVIYHDIEFSSSKESGCNEPFFIWKRNDKINKLFIGEEIELEANIEESPNFSAIKFKEIGIYPKNANESKQKKLDDILQNFGIVMTMVGKMHYRCIDKIYSFTGDESIVINYSFERNSNGKPLLTNKIYQKLEQMDYILSPYTTWRIRLIGSANNFNKLKEFENNEIYLELSGRGQYIQHELLSPEICNKESDIFNYTLKSKFPI